VLTIIKQELQMKKQSNMKIKEQGQALVMIALAAVALFAFAALAIDGSMVFSDRRHAQNAADTSAMAAALAKVRAGTWQSDGLTRASSNGYNNNGTTNEVYVYNPPVDGVYAGNNQYVQVKIISQVKTLFARVIGISQLTNRVEAVTREIPSNITPSSRRADRPGRRGLRANPGAQRQRYRTRHGSRDGESGRAGSRRNDRIRRIAAGDGSHLACA
jgi:hypothetical protein